MIKFVQQCKWMNEWINEIDYVRVHSNVTHSVDISKTFGMKPSNVYLGRRLQDSGSSGGATFKATLNRFISILKIRIFYAKSIKHVSNMCQKSTSLIIHLSFKILLLIILSFL